MKRLTVLAAVLAGGLAAPASAQMAFGPQVSYGLDSDLGVGARVEVPFTRFITAEAESPLSTMRLIGSFDWFFWDPGANTTNYSWMEINANAAYPLEVEGMNSYVGGGLNIARWGYDDEFGNEWSYTDTGLNVLGGLNFALANLSSFAEARLELGGGSQLVLTFGVLFGGE